MYCKHAHCSFKVLMTWPGLVFYRVCAPLSFDPVYIKQVCAMCLARSVTQLHTHAKLSTGHAQVYSVCSAWTRRRGCSAPVSSASSSHPHRCYRTASPCHIHERANTMMHIWNKFVWMRLCVHVSLVYFSVCVWLNVCVCSVCEQY